MVLGRLVDVLGYVGRETENTRRPREGSRSGAATAAKPDSALRGVDDKKESGVTLVQWVEETAIETPLPAWDIIRSVSPQGVDQPPSQAVAPELANPVPLQIRVENGVGDLRHLEKSDIEGNETLPPTRGETPEDQLPIGARKAAHLRATPTQIRKGPGVGEPPGALHLEMHGSEQGERRG